MIPLQHSLHFTFAGRKSSSESKIECTKYMNEWMNEWVSNGILTGKWGTQCIEKKGKNWISDDFCGINSIFSSWSGIFCT